MNTIITGDQADEALAADLAQLRQLAEITGEDALAISARETATYRTALREARAALDATRDAQLAELLDGAYAIPAEFGGRNDQAIKSTRDTSPFPSADTVIWERRGVFCTG